MRAKALGLEMAGRCLQYLYAKMSNNMKTEPLGHEREARPYRGTAHEGLLFQTIW